MFRFDNVEREMSFPKSLWLSLFDIHNLTVFFYKYKRYTIKKWEVYIFMYYNNTYRSKKISKKSGKKKVKKREKENQFSTTPICSRIIWSRNKYWFDTEIGNALPFGIVHPFDSAGRLFPVLFSFFPHTWGEQTAKRKRSFERHCSWAKWRSLVKATSFPRLALFPVQLSTFGCPLSFPNFSEFTSNQHVTSSL